MSVTPLPHPVWMDRPLSHTSVHTCNGWVRVRLNHAHKHLRISLHMYVQSCGRVVWSNAQVAMTDLEDVVDGSGQRLPCGGCV